MKNLSTILASVSLALNAAFGVGAYIVYEKAKEILGDPKSFVTEVVKEQLKAIEKLPIPNLNTGKFKLP